MGENPAKKEHLTWQQIKERGSEHYKIDPTKVEPIDLYRSGGFLRDFAVGNIIKYAYRNRSQSGQIRLKDMDKIKHYTDMLICLAEEEQVNEQFVSDQNRCSER